MGAAGGECTGGQGPYTSDREQNEAALREETAVFDVPHEETWSTLGPGSRLPLGYRIPLSNLFGYAIQQYRQQWMAAAQDALKGGTAQEVLRELVLPKDAAAVSRIIASGTTGSANNQHMYYVNSALVKIVGDELSRHLRAGMRVSSHGLAAEVLAGEGPMPAAAAQAGVGGADDA